jgi:hypothetical protein
MLYTLSCISHSFQPSRRKSDAAGALFKDRDRLMIQEGYTGVQITKITTQCRTTFQRWLAKNEEVLRYEEMHNIEIRWAPTMQEYEDGLVLVRERKYRRALDDLERLVVQRLFEMTKLGMNGVGVSKFFFVPQLFLYLISGYKLREKISKSLKT